MKHFLFLMDELPPTQSANGICVDKVINELLLMGHRVSCVCWGKQNKEGVTVHQIKQKPFDRAVLTLSKKNNIFSKLLLLILRIGNRLHHIISLPWWPAKSFITAKNFYKKASDLIDTEVVTDVIAVSYPGETLVAMKKLKRKYKNKIKTIMYPLDVTLFGTNYGTRIEKKISKSFNKRFMISCAQYADKILVLENAREYFEKTMSVFLQSKFIIVGIPLLIPKNNKSLKQNSEKRDIHIAFTGNLIASVRDPSAVFDLLDRFARRVDYRIYFDLYGKYDDCISRLIKEKKYAFIFVDHGWVKEGELARALSTADILVNIGNNSPLIPSKLFLYLSHGAAIIHQYAIDDDPCLYYLKQYQNAYLFRVNKTITDDEILELETFICKSNFIQIDVGGIFERCTPAFTAKMLE